MARSGFRDHNARLRPLDQSVMSGHAAGQVAYELLKSGGSMTKYGSMMMAVSLVACTSWKLERPSGAKEEVDNLFGYVKCRAIWVEGASRKRTLR